MDAPPLARGPQLGRRRVDVELLEAAQRAARDRAQEGRHPRVADRVAVQVQLAGDALATRAVCAPPRKQRALGRVTSAQLTRPTVAVMARAMRGTERSGRRTFMGTHGREALNFGEKRLRPVASTKQRSLA